MRPRATRSADRRGSTTKAEQKRRTHETILDAAARLIRNRGISGARVADVMSGAGLTVGGFYAHFDSKRVLVDEALRRTSAALRTQLFAQIDAEAPARRLAIVVKRYLSSRHRDETELCCPLPAVVGEIGTTAPEHRDVLAEQLDAMARAFELHLPASRAMSRRTVALGLVALLYGGLSLARALRGSELSDEILRAARASGALIAGSERDAEHAAPARPRE
jgi:TetR/AcrR family transcriptional repressor of nem operon